MSSYISMMTIITFSSKTAVTLRTSPTSRALATGTASTSSWSPCPLSVRLPSTYICHGCKWGWASIKLIASSETTEICRIVLLWRKSAEFVTINTQLASLIWYDFIWASRQWVRLSGALCIMDGCLLLSRSQMQTVITWELSCYHDVSPPYWALRK